ncbi:hypothetical protein GCM10023212_17050 [Luteolibacter yonseiensis]
MVAGALGLVWLLTPLVKIAIFYASDDTHVILSYRLTGSYAWVYLSAALLAILPCLGIVPGIGKRPLLVASLALLAMPPAAFAIYFELTSNP